MNTLYPVFLKLTGKKCIVAGGGRVAMNKVEKLLESKADVTVVSPSLTEDLEELALRNSFHILRREFRKRDLKDAFLIISATDCKETNRRIANEAWEAGILCNVADDPALCNFYVPSVYQTGDLKIAVSTNGKSPAAAKKIKEELSLIYGSEIADVLESLGVLRKKLEKKVSGSRERGKILSDLIREYTFASTGRKNAEEIGKLKEEIERWSS